MFDSLIITPDGMNSTYHVPVLKVVVREWGNDLGFTQLPKFTYWESLTPEPLLITLRCLSECQVDLDPSPEMELEWSV